MSNGVVTFINVQTADSYLRSELKECEDCGYSDPHVPGQVTIPNRTRKLISGVFACLAQDISRRALDEPGSEKLERSLKNYVDCYAKIERINLAKAKFERDGEKALQKDHGEKNRRADDVPAAERRASVAPSVKRVGRAPSAPKSGIPPASVRSAEVLPVDDCSGGGLSPASDSPKGCSTESVSETSSVAFRSAKVPHPSRSERRQSRHAANCRKDPKDRRTKKRPRRVDRSPSRRERRAALQVTYVRLSSQTGHACQARKPDVLGRLRKMKPALHFSCEIAREHLESNPVFAEVLRDYLSGKWQPPSAYEDIISRKFNSVHRAPPEQPAVNKFADIPAATAEAGQQVHAPIDHSGADP